MKWTSMRFDGISTAEFKFLGATSADPYVITNVEGLGPTENDASISKSPQAPGFFQGSYSNSRQIVVTVQINPNRKTGLTVDKLREALYWMMESQYAEGVSITLMNGANELCSVVGYATRMEPALFSKKPELVVTFECLDDTFASKFTRTKTSTNGRMAVTPEGTARTLPMIYLDVLKSTPKLTIQRLLHGRVQETFVLTGFNYIYGDRLTIGTSTGQKRVTMYRLLAPASANHLRYMDLGAKWPMLDPGVENVINAWGGDYMQGDVRLVQVSYKPKFRGV